MDLNEFRARREGIVTPLQLAEDLMNKVKAKEVEKVIIFSVNTDKNLYAGWAGALSNFELMGIIEGGKDEIKMILAEEDDY